MENIPRLAVGCQTINNFSYSDETVIATRQKDIPQMLNTFFVESEKLGFS